ncbi:hypothetical protein LCE28_27925 (plasmid) [Escherichia coli]|nr:hypothetical protein LCE28_27925 [Escherichia coli]
MRHTTAWESFVSGSGFSERHQQMTGNLLTLRRLSPWHNVVMLVPCSRARFRQQLARTLATIVNVVDLA